MGFSNDGQHLLEYVLTDFQKVAVPNRHYVLELHHLLQPNIPHGNDAFV